MHGKISQKFNVLPHHKDHMKSLILYLLSASLFGTLSASSTITGVGTINQQKFSFYFDSKSKDGIIEFDKEKTSSKCPNTVQHPVQNFEIIGDDKKISNNDLILTFALGVLFIPKEGSEKQATFKEQTIWLFTAKPSSINISCKCNLKMS